MDLMRMEKIPRFDWTLLLLQKGKPAAQDHLDGRSHTGNQRESERIIPTKKAELIRK